MNSEAGSSVCSLQLMNSCAGNSLRTIVYELDADSNVYIYKVIMHPLGACSSLYSNKCDNTIAWESYPSALVKIRALA